MGEVDGDGGDGRTPVDDEAGEPGAGGESERAAERGIPPEGGGLRGAAGGTAQGGRDERDFAGVSERVADGGAAGERGDGARIFGGDLLLVDEASRVSDDLYRAVRPMLAVSGGTLWLMSTPNGKRGILLGIWSRPGEEWERVQVPARECGRISEEFLAEEERAMGDRWFRQEYLCEFTETSGALFSTEDLRRAMREDVEPLEV